MATAVIMAEDWAPPRFEKSEREVEMLSERVSRNVLMRHLMTNEVQTMVMAFQRRLFSEGDTVIEEGAEGDLFYVIEDGRCDVIIKDIGLVAKIDGGGGRDFFGELALLYNSPRAATVQATTPVVAWALDRMTFKMIMQDSAVRQTDKYNGFIEKVPLLSGLSAYEKLQLADSLRPAYYDSDDLIIREGDEGHDFFLVEDGEVICTKISEEGKELEVSHPLGPGTYFGELALINDDKRAASVRALEPTRCATVDRATFKRLLGPLADKLKENFEMYAKYVDDKYGAK
jgi:cAMP-dependent protein kinase regulator